LGGEGIGTVKEKPEARVGVPERTGNTNVEGEAPSFPQDNRDGGLYLDVRHSLASGGI